MSLYSELHDYSWCKTKKCHGRTREIWCTNCEKTKTFNVIDNDGRIMHTSNYRGCNVFIEVYHRHGGTKSVTIKAIEIEGD